MIWNDRSARSALKRMFDAAVASAQPARVLAAHLPPVPDGPVLVLGAGKSAATMAAALEAAWPDADLSGLVVTRYGHAVPTARIEVVQASHPVPDEAGAEAARRMLAIARAQAGRAALVVALVSGGGSALLPLPAAGLSLADKQAINRALLACGASIGEMNVVRRHLSAIKGGRLAAACAPTPVLTLAMSDVPGDDPGVIASGPTVPDPTTSQMAQRVLARYRITPPPAAAAWLARPESETPKTLAGARLEMIATPAMALRAAADVARAAGLAPLILGDAIEGESRELGRVLAGIASGVRAHSTPLPAPAVLLSGGETTVTLGVEPPGRGGRNTECLLGLALALDGVPGIWALAADTDGIDGSEDAAGATLGPDTLARARAVGLDPAAALAGHDSYGLFAAAGELLLTGPTLTNVNDFRAVLVA